MKKYEIMLVTVGDIDVSEAKSNLENLFSLFNSLPNYQEQVIEKDMLAYEIQGKTVCHRFILTFDLDDPKILLEFNRLALLNKTLLRHLVINQTKDRSFRARNNPKKIKDFEIRQEKFKQYLEYKKNTNAT